MIRDDIKALAGELCLDLNDEDSLDIFIDEVFRDLARMPKPQMVEAVIKSLTSGTSTYAYEDDMIQILHAIMQDKFLSPVVEADLDAYSQTWESAANGTSVVYTQDILSSRNYRLWPTPDTTSDAFIILVGEPWGEDFPDNSLTLIYADDRTEGIADIFALPIAFDALAREFTYPSDHEDSEVALAYQTVARLFRVMLQME